MKISHLIFDLDGTLIDSSDSILASFKGAFEKVGLEPVRPLTSDVIGPPLRKTLVLLSGSEEVALLNDLENYFKDHYDTLGYKNTTIFQGISEVLANLYAHDASLYIATNKRIKPTRLILDYLGWTHYFLEVVALDFINPPAKNKSELLTYLLRKYAMDSDFTLYLGDRIEDKQAAQIAGLNFIFASWGYGINCDSNLCSGDLSLSDPKGLLSFVNAAF